MKKILLITLLLPALSYSQGLFVATSTSTDLIESNMGSTFTGSESIVVSSLTITDSTIDAINEDIVTNSLLSMVPNPCTDMVSIESQFDMIEIFDSNGKHVESINSYNKVVSLGHLKRGFYFVSAFYDQNYIGTAKIIKQ